MKRLTVVAAPLLALGVLVAGAELAQVNDWGFELLKPDEQRLRTRGLRVGDVVRLDLR